MEKKVLQEKFNTLFAPFHGHTVSSQARSELKVSDSSFTYGEITPETFEAMLNIVTPKSGEVFYDLGAGIGKAVMWAAMSFPFKKAVGVELLEKIRLAAKEMLEKYHLEIKPSLSPEKEHQLIDFVQGDFCQYDFSDADVLFTHSTCFSNETMNILAQKFACLKPGSRIITISKNLTHPNLKQIHTGSYQMGWGTATAYCYQVIDKT